MDLLTVSALRELVNYRQENCVSIYMPTIRAGREVKQNAIRFKSLLQSLESDLEKKGMRKKEINKYVSPLKEMVQDDNFWRKQEDGLAVFYSGEESLVYRLPLDFEEKYFVDDRYYVRPLLPIFVENERFYVLSLQLSRVKLLAGTRFNVGEVDLGETPQSMDEFLQYEDPERRLAFHNTGSPSAEGHKGVFHQHLPEEDEKEEILRFFHRVDEGITDSIGGEDIPLVVVGAEHLLPLYREANTYSCLSKEISRGNPESLNPQEIHDQAWKVIQPKVQTEIEGLKDKYHALKGRDKASDVIGEILPAADHGQVEALMTVKGEHIWGEYAREAQKVKLHRQREVDSRDLMELAAVHTLINGGQVYDLEESQMPDEDQKIAAIMRY